MRKEIGLLTFFCLFFIINLNAQDYLKIVGKFDYTKKPESYILKVDLNGLSAYTISQIDSSLMDNEIYFTIDSLNQLAAYIPQQGWAKLDYTNGIIAKNDLRNSSKYYYPISKKESEDLFVIRAIENANSKASIISSVLDRKIKRILNIDDVTPKYLSIFDEGIYSSCMKQNAEIIIDYIYGEQEVGLTEFDKNEISSSYFIYVTYELE